VIRRRRLALLASVAAVALAPAAASAATPWVPVQLQCLTANDTAGCTTQAQFGGAWDIAISPDGRSAYVAAWDADALVIFDRNPATGALTRKPGLAGCISETGSGGVCTDGRLLAEADAVEVSPDGGQVYVGSGFSTGAGGVAVFDRDPNTGALTQKVATAGCFSNTGAADGVAGQCFDARGISSALGFVLSPDGRFLYMSGYSSIASFSRDPTTGALSQLAGNAGCVNATGGDGCLPGRALGFGRQSAMAPDGLHLYVANSTNDSIAVLSRNTSTGALSQAAGPEGCVSRTVAGCHQVPALQDVLSVVAGRSGAQVYALGSSGIFTLDRFSATGALALSSCLTDAGDATCANGRGLTGPIYGAVSPDGEALVAVMSNDSAQFLGSTPTATWSSPPARAA
jgi:DNA-binding beta-propeller fold protein YncE